MTLRKTFVLILLAGVLLLGYSLTLPYYSNADAANELINEAYSISQEEYYDAEQALRTNKVFFMDFGSGLIVASLTILLFLLVTKTKKLNDLKAIRTPNKLTIWVTANLVWLLLVPGTFWYYSFRGQRGDYPPFADSLGIPIYSQILFLLVLLIPLNLFVLITTFKASLPARMFIKSNVRVRTVLFWEIFFAFCFVINGFFFLDFLIDGDHVSILVNLFFTFVLLALRAGQIKRWNDLEA